MQTFNNQIKKGTLVALYGEYGYRVVKQAPNTLGFIKLHSLSGNYQAKDIRAFSNNPKARLYPSLNDLYVTGFWGNVFHKNDNGTLGDYIGELQGRTLKQFALDLTATKQQHLARA